MRRAGIGIACLGHMAITVKRQEPTERALLLLRYRMNPLTQSEVTDPSFFLTRCSVTGRVSGTADPLFLCAPHTDRETDTDRLPTGYLQKDLVPVVVLRLPPPLADGAAGVGQEGHELTDVLDSELQHRVVGGDGVLVTGQPFEGELDVHIQAGEDGEDAEVHLPLAGAPPEEQLIELEDVSVVVMAAVDGEAHDLPAVVHGPDGPQRRPGRQREEVLAAGQVGQEPAGHALRVVVAPGRPLQRAVQLQDGLLAVCLLQEENHRQGGLRRPRLRGLPPPPGSPPFGDPEQLQVWVDPSQDPVDGLLQGLGLPWVCDYVDANQERVLWLLHGELTWEHKKKNKRNPQMVTISWCPAMTTCKALAGRAAAF